ncbi:MAG TPA: hydrogenase 3 maturation endopeptidase HyCI [Anaerolineales bacterium]|nr:hydrogenase 3 maturation endopeptidase HyCI [Anaerolineales bacterium]
MSDGTWQASLTASLQSLKKPERPLRMAVLGIGHELCGDDAVGVRLAGQLKTLAAGNADLLAVEAGPAPENFTGTLRRFGPDLVLLVDAALMDADPGSVRWLDWRGTDGMSASTHTLPLHLLAAYLTDDLGCQVQLLGIQPAQTFADAPLTPKVREAAEQVARELIQCLSIG